MGRCFLSLWLPYFATDRLGRQAEPVVTVMEQAGTQRIAAANPAAVALGIKVGMSLADARALHPTVITKTANPLRENKDLHALADSCERFTPLVAFDASDGLMLDVTGCEHLFGGAEGMANAIARHAARRGFMTRLAMAETPGAAWALSHFAPDADPSPHTEGDLAERLSPLPLAALRLPGDSVAALEQVGLRRIADLLSMPRAALASRFGAYTLLRLDQALGRTGEALTPHRPPPPVRVRHDWETPLLRSEDLAGATEHLLQDLCQQLAAAEQGARQVAVACYDTEGRVHRAVARTSMPVRQAKRLAALLLPRMEAFDLGFGIDTLTLSALQVEQWRPAHDGLWHAAEQFDEAQAAMIDKISQRHGPKGVVRMAPVASYLPEKQMRPLPALTHSAAEVRQLWQGWRSPIPHPMPVRLLAKPEPIKVSAPPPDYPPTRLRWRNAVHTVAHSEGPMRITPEWWNDAPADDPAEPLAHHTRDYYRLELPTGPLLWVFCRGRTAPPSLSTPPRSPTTPPMPEWFVHGIYN